MTQALLGALTGWLGWGSGASGAQAPEVLGLAQYKTMAEVLQGLGVVQLMDAPEVRLTVPDETDQGASVSVSVRSAWPQTEQITVLVPGNPSPWVATFEGFDEVEPWITLRIKLAQSSQVWAIVKAQDRFYRARATVRVTQGGCGA